MAKKTREPTPEAEDEIFEVETVRDHRVSACVCLACSSRRPNLLARANLDRLSLLRLAASEQRYASRFALLLHLEQETVDDDGYINLEFRESDCCLRLLFDRSRWLSCTTADA